MYDAILLDLDGVIYRGKEPIPGATHALQTWHNTGTPYAFITNNAARDVEEIAQTIASFDIHCTPQHVRTSAQAAAEKLAHDIDTNSAVLVLGSEFLRSCVASHGFSVITPDNRDWLTQNTPAAVVQGFGPSTTWTDISWAITAVRNGAQYRPTNPDKAIPTGRGIMPGNGTFVDIVATFSGATPVYAGKPEPTMLTQTIDAMGASNPLMVGDQLETDIEAAVAAGIDSALTLTGVTSIDAALRAPQHQRPTRIVSGLPDLLEELPVAEVGPTEARCGSASVRVEAGVVARDGDPLLAANAALAYMHAHNTGLDAGTLSGQL